MDEKAAEIKELVNSILGDGENSPDIKYGELPAIDLYMDQLTTFLEERLRPMLRDTEAEKFLTKTMINNYAKNDLIPPPVKKKYTREHLIFLILIFYNKSFLSMDDIKKLLEPLRTGCGEGSSFNTPGELYSFLLEVIDKERPSIKKQISEYEEKARRDIPAGDDAEKIRRFLLLSMLSYDVYVKKLMIERLLDMDSESGSRKSHTDRRKKDI